MMKSVNPNYFTLVATQKEITSLKVEESVIMGTSDYNQKLVHFLQQELDIPPESIALVQRHPELPYSSFPMLLWRYGLITTVQLERIFDWLDSSLSYSATQL